MTRLTGVFGWTFVARRPGSAARRAPSGELARARLVWVPTLRPAWVRCDPAAAGDCPSTLGTETEVWRARHGEDHRDVSP